jgi:hypothetical protein
MIINYKEIAITIAIVDFVLYVAYIWGRYGIQKSISISFYELPEHERDLFRVFILVLALAVIISGIGFDNIAFYISGGLLSLVGIFSRIQNKKKFIIHLTGAIGGIISCNIALMLEDFKMGLYSTTIVLVGIILVLLFGNRKHLIWNIEIICFSVLIIALRIIIEF